MIPPEALHVVVDTIAEIIGGFLGVGIAWARF
jgi:hypothetical protein